MTSMILVRHGETDWNRDGRLQGATDVPLNDEGRRQAQDAATALSERLVPSHPVLVGASDLSRATETAEIIATGLGAAPPRRYRALRERTYGEAEGVRMPEFRERWGRGPDLEIPGAESREQLLTRALGGLHRIAADVRRATAPASPTVVVVTHGGLIREIIRHGSGGELPLAGERLANCSMHEIRWERDRLTLVSTALVSAAV